VGIHLRRLTLGGKPEKVVDAETFSDNMTTPADELPVEKVELVFAPNVPPPITRRHRAVLKVEMISSVITEKLHGDYKYEFWTFDGRLFFYHCFWFW